MGTTPAKSLTGLGQAVDLLRKESDRGAALIMGEWLSEMCSSLLRRVFIEGFKDDDLLESQRPLGTFASRSLACYAFGLISKDVYRSIQFIRKIRNAAAHFSETNDGGDGVEFSLKEEPNRSHITSIRQIMEASPQHLGIDSREELITCFAILSAYMARQRQRVHRRGPAEEIVKF